MRYFTAGQTKNALGFASCHSEKFVGRHHCAYANPPFQQECFWYWDRQMNNIGTRSPTSKLARFAVKYCKRNSCRDATNLAPTASSCSSISLNCSWVMFFSHKHFLSPIVNAPHHDPWVSLGETQELSARTFVPALISVGVVIRTDEAKLKWQSCIQEKMKIVLNKRDFSLYWGLQYNWIQKKWSKTWVFLFLNYCEVVVSGRTARECL